MRKSLFLLCALLLLISVACDRSAREAVPQTVRAEVALLPDESAMVMYGDVQKISQSALAADIIARLESEMRHEMSDSDFVRFKEATGFDPQKDLHSILLGAREGEQIREEAAVIIHGKFDEQRIIAFMKEEIAKHEKDVPWQEETIAGHQVYFGERRRDFGVCFANANTMYLGSRTWLTEVLEGKTTPALPQAFTAAEKSLRYAEQFWLSLAVDGEQMAGHGMGRELRKNFPKFDAIQDAVFSARAGEGVEFEGRVQCDNEENSKLMVDLLKGGLAAAKLQVSNDRTAVDALNSIKIDQKGSQVLLHGELTKKFFDTLREQKLLFWGDMCRKHI
ncbi:hypothetical protein HUU05_27395 [candidate division KSB1 bacterium]|nr:hypothetical protein [candidate division KSB1 bacterium]